MSGEDSMERRKDEVDFKLTIIRKLDAIESDGKFMKKDLSELAKRIEDYSLSSKTFRAVMDEDIHTLRVAIQGDESRGISGIASTLKNLSNQFLTHVRADTWGFSIMISLMVTILGWTVFNK